MNARGLIDIPRFVPSLIQELLKAGRKTSFNKKRIKTKK
jgi:hypothetical protein